MATTQSILSEAQCFVCTGEMDLFQAIEIGILRNMLTELGAPMTQAEINAASSCFLCYGMSLAEANILVLLNSVAANISGGGGGGGTIQDYIGRDPAAPDDPTKSALSYPSGGGSTSQWDVASQAWV